MKIGRDDAHGEMILAQIYVERGKRQLAYLLRAERIAEQAGKMVNLGDIRLVWGFWHKRFGTQRSARDALLKALRTLGRMEEFDRK